jgi:tRNA 2-thiouridine synthesizing protein A
MTNSDRADFEETGREGAQHVPIAATWDAGDMGCGELVMQLRIRLKTLPPGTVLRVVARDPAAPQDLPAWCRMTGHRLVQASHPIYDIQRKET